MERTVIYAGDDGYVEFEDPSTLHWHWDNTPWGEGTEIIPFEDAADYFESAGREDIAELIRNRETCEYGHRGTF